MIKLPTADGVSSVNARLLKALVPVQPLALFKCFREADPAAAAAERVVLSARANQSRGGASVSLEQVQLAATLRATADQIFTVTMREWGKLGPAH